MKFTSIFRCEIVQDTFGDSVKAVAWPKYRRGQIKIPEVAKCDEFNPLLTLVGKKENKQ